MFKEFYGIYPRKKAPLDAEKAFNQMIGKGYDPKKMIEGAKKFAAECRSEGTDAKFIPYPASWLRAGGFLEYDHQETIIPKPLFRKFRDLAEAVAYCRERFPDKVPLVQKCRSLDDLPIFVKVCPVDWQPSNVTQMRRA